jgi:RNA polymerase sigma factor (sigma-70 family)
MDDDRVDVGAVVAAALAGDQGAWDDLVDRYAPLIAAVVVGYRMSGADGEDVAQIVWMRLVEHLGELREPRALPKWLIVTTRNECCRSLRAQGRVGPFDPLTEDLEETVDHATPDEPLLLAERCQVVLEAMAELSDRQRAVLWIFAENPDISFSEVSRRLGIPVGSIGPTRIRAAAKLRACPAVAALYGSEFGVDDLGGGQNGTATGG